MSRSAALLLVLIVLGAGAGLMLHRVPGPGPSLAESAPAAPTAPPDLSVAASSMALLSPGADPAAFKPDAGSPQIKLLQDQISYLQDQVQALHKENSQLIDKLASLTGKPGPAMQAAPCDPGQPATSGDGPDFVGVGIELVKERQIQDIPIVAVEVDRERVEQLITKWFTTQFPPEQGRLQGRALAALGAIPDPVDTIALKAAFLSHQIGGWYEEADQTLYIARSEGGMEGVARKENALALGYGYLFKRYGQKLFPPRAGASTLDARLSRDCLMAGDAALTRFLHSLKNPLKGGGGGVGEDPDDPSRAVPIPNFLRELELIPFSAGFDFMQALHSVGEWEQVNAAYERPPIATAEVLDPQVYLGETAFAMQPIEFADTKINGAAPLWQDTLGPVATVLMLKQRVPAPIASDTAPGWANDRLLTYPAAGKASDHAVWQTVWRDSNAADAFFSALRQWLQGRYKGATEPAGAPVGVFRLQTSERSVQLQRTHRGSGVLLVDAADAEFLKAAVAKLAK